MAENFDPAKKPCPDCGGERIWAETGADSVSVKPKGSSSFYSGTELRPLVCLNCGLTLLYHPEPGKAVKQPPDKGRK